MQTEAADQTCISHMPERDAKIIETFMLFYAAVELLAVYPAPQMLDSILSGIGDGINEFRFIIIRFGHVISFTQKTEFFERCQNYPRSLIASFIGMTFELRK